MTKKLFLDTNVWLRYLLADNKNQFEDCQKLLTLNEQGKFRLYTSTICLMEIAYTLNSFYKIKRGEIISDLKNILAVRNLTLIEKTNFTEALNFFQKYQIKLTDCLIASQLPKSIALCTYDHDFKKIKNLHSLTPTECLSI